MYRRKSIMQIVNNDTKRYFDFKQEKKEQSAYQLKVDKIFADTRNYVHSKYSITKRKY
jgi:hypothetical protein